MKRFTKILFNILAAVMLCGVCFGLTACEDIKELEITVSVYSADDEAVVDKKLKIDLYRHLAPDTVDHIINDCVNKNYYDNAVFYKFSESNTSQIMMGDLLYVGGEIVNNKVAPAVNGEFSYNNTVGSNLLNKEGSVSLWRTWTAQDDTYSTNGSYNTGRGTWFMPTSTISGYDGYFCVFAQIDLDDEDNNETWNDIKNLFDNADDYESYVIYYTGEYDAAKTAEENYGLDFHCVSLDEFDEMSDDAKGDIFEAEGGQYVEYNQKTVMVPFVKVNNTRVLAASVKSIKLV